MVELYFYGKKDQIMPKSDENPINIAQKLMSVTFQKPVFSIHNKGHTSPVLFGKGAVIIYGWGVGSTSTAIQQYQTCHTL